MFKTIIPLYIVCVALYILFSRQPDYQDGELTTGNIHYIIDSTHKTVPKAIFRIDKKQYTIDAHYALRKLDEGQIVRIIYDTSDPSKAAVYSWWGYWFKWDEMLTSILIPLILLYAAKAITAGPTPEALVEEMEMNNTKKRRKYDV